MMAPADTGAESPCVRVCAIDPATGYCCGCYRTLDEISFWLRYTPQQRVHVIQHLLARRAAAAGTRAMD